MPEIELVVANEEGGRTYYEPIVATVAKYSDYNKDQFSLTAANGYIKGYWSLSLKLAEKMGTPPIGTKGEWFLSTKPKTGDKAKPGSVYYDVMDVQRVPDSHQEPAPAANQSVAPKGAIRDNVVHTNVVGDPDAPYPAPVPAEWSLREAYWREKQANERASIQAQTAYNGLVALLNGPRIFSPGEEKQLKARFYDLLEHLVPGMWAPAEPESEGANAARTDAELGDEPDEDLPWGPPAQPKGSGVGWPAPSNPSKPAQTEMATQAAAKREMH